MIKNTTKEREKKHSGNSSYQNKSLTQREPSTGALKLTERGIRFQKTYKTSTKMK